eukprot:TRINITY_DN2858_c0_g1_i12.p1 TRINITY_DN2858_c0_g1~~TRINITY_DN2858_c0_g1_i12.p1  ORF type:complete len:141 (-),score=34.45 TRINITY_DN2858_c0_g1_i12:692-1114(-)
MATISATSIMLGSSIKRTNGVNQLGHRLNHPNGVMASSREPDQGLPVKKQEAVTQNVNLPPIIPKNKKKPYPIPLKKIQQAARADKKLVEKGIEKPLGPPKNGLLVHDLIPVAYEVLEAWKVLIKGLAQLLSVIPVYGCR